VCPAVGVEAAARGRRREDVAVVDRLFGAVGAPEVWQLFPLHRVDRRASPLGSAAVANVGDIHPAAV